MKRIIFAIMISVLVFSPLAVVFADGGISVDQDQIKIKINGIVCSFCAFGVYKNLSKLKSLDPKQFKKGVHVDIHTQMITLAMDDSQLLNLNEVYESIKKGGYEPVEFYFPLNGKTMKVSSEKILELGEISFQDILKELKSEEGVSVE